LKHGLGIKLQVIEGIYYRKGFIIIMFGKSSGYYRYYKAIKAYN